MMAITKVSFRLIVLLLVGGMPLITGAQVMIGIELPVARALLHEPVNVRVAVKNTGARVLLFGYGEGGANLRLHVEDRAGRIIRPFNERRILQDAEIMPGETKAFNISLTGVYGIHSERRYRISAVVDIAAASYASRDVWLAVVRGVELSRTTGGVPGDDEAMRVYILEYIQRDEAEFLFLRITDDRDKRVYGVYNLGRVARVRKPKLRTDGAGNVHALFESIGRNLIHTAYTAYGEQLFSTGIAAGRGGRADFHELPGGQLIVRTDPHVEVAPLHGDDDAIP